MSRARHRTPRSTPFVRADRSGRIALTFLAFAGLAGPTWSLRSQAGQLLDATVHRLVVAAPDIASAPLSTSR
ncbi:hypothetical protein HHL19_19055 [Streptomyces sp. R302]|uniref:hypothetical protein n=1 Tax=unclassified Streptomyces TaxID=2593676 RepID=UPI00145F9AF6|nr:MULTISPECIES: hypothetical protein [unclassified Streptomyces]NML54721.1 hypothetical protein [Streptomyces sp. R301]NML80710.1 hypothetical protein [Streptomyces sp. R302]